MKYSMKILLVLCLLDSAFTQGLRRKHVTVSAILGEPYLSQNEDGSYKGYVADLLKALSKQIGFKYNIQLVADGRYGTPNNTTGTWSGMMGEVVTGKVDMAVADLTITSGREQAVDFSYPFMFHGITILYKKPSKGRKLPIYNIEDLARQNKISVGTGKGGSTEQFFRDSNIATYQMIYQKMMENSGEYMLPTTDHGVEAVKQGGGKVAFIMESPRVDYAVERYCDLIQVGGILNQKGYGIVLPLGSSYRKDLNVALLQLQEDGVLNQLKKKWWQGTSSGFCVETDSSWFYNEDEPSVLGGLWAWLRGH